MRASHTLAGSLGVALIALGAAAVADERRGPVRTTATVEVIDDARQVDEIIARIQTQAPATPAARAAAAKSAPTPAAREPAARMAPGQAQGARDRAPVHEKAIERSERPLPAPLPARTGAAKDAISREHAIDSRRERRFDRHNKR